jgi:uncharacterized Zn-binding protein involved in type VI secretion
MRFSHELSYDAAPQAVHEMLGQRAFREKVCEALHASRSDVSVDGTPPGMTVVIDQTQPARGIPSFARTFVGDEIRILQRERWDDVSGGSMTLEIPGKPGTFTGSVALAAAGAGTVQTVSGDIAVKVPLLGGRLEGMIGDLFRAALSAEQRVGRAWLAGDR